MKKPSASAGGEQAGSDNRTPKSPNEAGTQQKNPPLEDAGNKQQAIKGDPVSLQNAGNQSNKNIQKASNQPSSSSNKQRGGAPQSNYAGGNPNILRVSKNQTTSPALSSGPSSAYKRKSSGANPYGDSRGRKGGLNKQNETVINQNYE